MRKFLLVGLVAAAGVFSAPFITVTPTLGPDVFTAPGSTFDDWSANVIANMRNPGAPDGSGVSTYIPLANGATLTGSEFIVTPFQSWEGVAPGPYSNQLGTVLYFSVKIVAGVGETFTLSQLSAQETYLGQLQLPYNAGDFTGPFNASRLVGVVSPGGADTVPGDNTTTTLLTELYYVGLGFGQPLDPSATGSDQNKINVTAAEVQALADRTTNVCYSLGGTTGCASVNVEGIPEPGTWALMGAGLAGLAFLRRRSA